MLGNSAPDRLGAHIEAALGQQVLDVSQAEVEPQLLPDGVLNDQRPIVQTSV